MKKLIATLGICLVFGSSIFGQYNSRNAMPHEFEKSRRNHFEKDAYFERNSLTHLKSEILNKIDFGLKSRRLSHHDAKYFNREFFELNNLEARYLRDSRLNQREIRIINDRYAALNNRIDHEMGYLNRNRRF